LLLIAALTIYYRHYFVTTNAGSIYRYTPRLLILVTVKIGTQTDR